MSELLDEFPLPDWADHRSDGEYLELGAQLATRDGRRCGNAFVNGLRTVRDLGQVADIVTDACSELTMTRGELEEFFHQPTLVMNIDLARAKFII